MMQLFDSDLGMQTPLLSQLDPDLVVYGRAIATESIPIPTVPYRQDIAEPSVHTNHTNGSSTSTNGNRAKVVDPSPAQSADSSADPELADSTLVSRQTHGERTNGLVDHDIAVVEQPSLNGSEPDGEEPEYGFLPVLKNRNFLVLWSGQVFSQLADKVYLVLMIMIITNRFQAAGQTISGWVSSIMIAFTIPAVLFGSIAGVYVDHWPKKAVLVFTNLLRGGLVLALPTLLWLSQGWSTMAGIPVGFAALLGITFLVSTLTQFFAPAEQATIPLIVERRYLLSANSLYTTTMMASVIIGFAVGEPLLAIADRLVAHLNPSLTMGKEFLVGVSYAIAGLVLMLLKTREKADDPAQPHPQVWENIRDGLRYLQQQRRVRAAMLQLIILFSIFAALAVLAVRLAEIMPAIKSSQFGFLLAAGGIGMALGAFIIGYFGQRVSRTQLSLYGSIGMAASLGALSLFTEKLVPTLLLLMALGGFAALIGIPMQTAIQEETPEEMRGKVFGLQNNAINIALSLPLGLAGIAETYLGLRTVFIALAALAIAGGAITWSLSHSEFAQISPK